MDAFGARAGVAQSVRFYLLVAFLLVCALGGGSARADALSLLYLRPAAVLLIAAAVSLPGRRRSPALRPAFALLGIAAAWATLQLVPLPPAIWHALPGHALLAGAAEAAAVAQPWRPASIAPELTLNALVSLAVPLAVLIAFAGLAIEQRLRLVPWTIGIAVASAIAGLMQLAGGAGSLLYAYRYTTVGLPVGLLANRNHQALLLAMALPLLAAWARQAASGRGGRPNDRAWIALGIGVALLPMILATGSRSGLVLGALGVVIAAAIAPRPPLRIALGGRRWAPGWLIWLAPIALVVVTVTIGRGMAVARLAASGGLSDEKRLTALPTIWRATTDFLPTGTGLGTFDPAFRIYEPDALMTPDYFNHAHNDWIEIAMTGGVPGVVLVAALLGVVGFATLAGLRTRGGSGGARRTTALAAAGAIGLVLVASVSDYPARTPLIGAISALALGWLLTQSERAPARAGGRGKAQ